MKNKSSILIKIIFFILGLAIFVGALLLAKHWMTHKPKASKVKEVVKIIPLVTTTQALIQNHQIIIEAMGNVVAAKKINLVSQVKGEVIYTNNDFIAGGVVKKGETLLKIQPLDYQLIKLQKQSDVEKAENDLSIEMGKQKVAKKEYSLLGANLAVKDQTLILRQPQLRLSQANLASAKARLKQAQLDLKRTTIKAPFNALIESQQVNVGSWQNAGTSLASLISTDEFWVEINLPVDRLALLNIPEFNSKNASKAVISYPNAWGSKTRMAKIKRLKPNIDSKVRMARLLLSVKDPLSFKAQNKNQAKLLLGSFVNVNINAKTLKNVLAIPRRALRNGHQLWLLNKNNQLHIVNIKLLWKNRQQIFINAKSLAEHSKIIISDLSTPIENMQLKEANHNNG